MAAIPLNVLILEDRPSDAELMVFELARAGFEPTWSRVESEEEYLAHQSPDLDVILADYTLPQFDALSALYRSQEVGLDIPFIIVTGSISEEVAVECMKQGAADYLLKDRLSRLGQAVRRALGEKEARDAKRRAQEALLESEERYRTISELTSDFAYALKVLPDGGMVCEWVTEAFTRITGFSLEDVATQGGWAALVHPDDRPLAVRRSHSLCSGQADVSEFRIVTREGETRLLRDHGRPMWDEARTHVIRIYGAAQDITERKQAEQALEHQALHDALTDLPNRTLLHDRLRQAILTADRDRKPLALVVMDLDRFKDVNDTLGHQVGDILLRQVGQRLQTVLRSFDTIARLGGDEFAVLLPTADETAAALATRRLLEALERPFMLEGQQFDIGGSVGIALYPEHGSDSQTLLRRADVAMYMAKRANSGYAVYSMEQDQHTKSRLAMMGDLRQAIEKRQLVLHYQPKIDLKRGIVAGAEALVRWEHPSLGLVPPDEFIPLAEQTVLIEPLSRWVLGAALRQCQIWDQSQLDIPVAVNLSMRNLYDPHLPDSIAKLLATWGVSPDRLKVEITESMVMADPSRAMDVLSRLREMGVKIAIDDFGTGYSSLAYLNRLPVDELKIDKSFVMRMALDESDAAIVRSTIELGHNLGLQVVAEGVENQHTVDLLASLGCDAVQGFHLAKPLPPAAFMEWLQKSPWSGGLGADKLLAV